MKRSWFALLFAMAFPSVMAWLYFEALAAPAVERAPTAGPNLAVMIAYYLGKVLQFAFPLAWVWAWERARLRPALPNLGGLLFGVGFGLLIGAALLALYYGALRGSRFLEKTPEQLAAKLADFNATTPLRFWLMASFICVLHSFLEEYYYRWFIFGGLKDNLPWSVALIVSALAFMGHHVIVLVNYLPLGMALFFSLCVALGGGVWAWLYHRTGSLVAAWLSHLLIDAAIMVVGYDLAFVLR